MIFTVTRHGETIENAEQIVQGQNFGTLSTKGKQQIENLATCLKDEHFDAIFCSDLPRCVATCEAISKYHTDTPITYDARLREHRMGVMEGKSFSELAEQGWSDTDVDYVVEGGESWREVRQRLVPFINEVLNGGYERVLLVTHGGTMRCMRSIFVQQPLEETILHHYDNCAIQDWETIASSVR